MPTDKTRTWHVGSRTALEVVPSEVLAKQLATIRQRRCLAVQLGDPPVSDVAGWGPTSPVKNGGFKGKNHLKHIQKMASPKMIRNDSEQLQLTGTSGWMSRLDMFTCEFKIF